MNSGSEANDLAMHLARLYTGRYDLVTLRNGYHGMSSNTMGLTSQSIWKYNVPTGFGVHHAMNPGKFFLKYFTKIVLERNSFSLNRLGFEFSSLFKTKQIESIFFF